MNLTLVITVIVIIFLIVFYYLFRWLKFYQLFQQEINTSSKDKKTFSFNWLLPFSHPQAERRIREIQQKHHHKVQNQQLEEVFQQFSKEPTKITPTHFHRLKAMVHTYERHHQKQPDFQNLDHLIAKLNEWEQNKPLSKKEKHDILQELKKIAQKS